MDNALPSDECQKKIKLYSLFKEIIELSDSSLVPQLIDHFQKESLIFQNADNFFEDFSSNKRKQKIYFGYRNFIDALMWLHVKEEKKEKEDSKAVVYSDGFVFSTGQICNLLKITASELAAYRRANEVVEDVDYIRQKKKDGTTAKYAPYLYHIGKTCIGLYNIPYEDFCRPGFDLEQHKREETSKVFDSINKSS